MIFITQGHEKSISIEVLVKALMMISRDQHKHFTLVTDTNVLKQNMKDLGIKHLIKENRLYIDHLKINIQPSIPKTHYSSFNSIEDSLQTLGDQDILITMPTIKEVFKINNTNYTGHTEYLRSRYKKNLTMNFINGQEQVLILTDHLPLNKVSNRLTKESIIEQIDTSLTGLEK